MSRFLLFATALALSAPAYAQLQSTVTYPPPVILSGLVPAPVGGAYNSPSLTVTTPGGVIFMPGSTNQSLAVPGFTYTYPPNAVTIDCVGTIFGNVVHQTAACTGFSLALQVVATGPSYLDYIQGRMAVWPSAYPMPEVAENPDACSSLGGVALVNQSLCLNGNWSVVTSADRTQFNMEGLGTSTALDVNPQVGCIRFVPGRPPEPNDYICEVAVGFGAGAENSNAIGVQYGAIIGRIVDPNEATRAGRVDLATVDPANNSGSGTFARTSIIKGLFMAGAAGDVPGGDCGAYCINTSRIAINGVDVTKALVAIIAQTDPATAAKIRAAGDELDARPIMDTIPQKFPLVSAK